MAPADERVGEDLRHQLQALHQGVWPVARLPQGSEAQGANGRPAPHREWEDQGGLDPDLEAGLPVDMALCRQLVRRGDGQHAAGQYVLDRPGVPVLAQRLGRSQALQGPPGVGGCDDARVGVRPPPKHRQIEAERLGDTPQRVLDLAVDLGGRQLHESRGEIGDECVELEKAREALCGGLRPIAGLGHKPSIRTPDWRRNIDPWAILRPARTPSPVRRPRTRHCRNPSLSALWPPVTDLAVRRHGSSTTEERASTGERDRR